MKCRKMIKYIPFYRQKELPFYRRFILNIHLKHCEECQKQSHFFLMDEQRLAALKQEPKLNNPKEFTHRIMRSLPEQPFEPVMALRFYKIKWGLAFSAFCLIALFALQQLHISQRMNRLEQRMTNSSQQTLLPASHYLLSFLQQKDQAKLMQIEEKELFELLSELEELKSVLHYLIKDHPQLQHINLQDGLDDRELSDLISYKEEIAKSLYDRRL